ncbi:hypothetical protein [Deinococcus cellulosilyticus]|uniref:Uncharacterized protein n=1 Tax=Deinococcus cellulosilyticus (strain DSM 18568 / NBRC 106333 / KACC 11606 / 5516J-15) TaxID=1223518 RepID=A0A511N2E8_DEIC1|nr:hypothetical protein [Deinococcus cellulosilyticus]GEM47029.1 hypothetical protein DC3_26640 [Deinococcus cellulosilyticus NBRC 106333 = KACC 11606]
MSQKSIWPIIGIALSPLLLALLGLFHPHDLNRMNAQSWTTLHLFLLLLFPMLGVNLWWLASGIPGVSAWAIRVLGMLYIIYYGALDVLAGIATGLMVQKNLNPQSSEVLALFNTGNTLSQIGVWSFLLASLVVLFLYWQLVGRRAFLGGFLLIASAFSFLNSHIYYPVGVITMLLMAAGFALLMQSRTYFR